MESITKPDLSRSITHHPHLFNLPHVPPISSIRTRRRTQTAHHLAGHEHEPRFAISPQPPLSETGDLEAQSSPEYRADIFNFLSSYKSPSELSAIEAEQSHVRNVAANHLRVPFQSYIAPIYRSRSASRRLRLFYEKQNEAIDRMLTPVEEHVASARREVGAEALRVKIAVYGSLGANILLSALQIFAAATSGSLSLITTMADAVFDPLSNLMLILTNRAIHRVDPRRFPAGRARLETAGNIVFCFVMVMVSVLIIAFAIRDLSDHAGQEGVNGFYLPSVVAVVTSFTTKMVLFLYCYPLRMRYSQVRIVWQDHRNDLFINGFGILTCVGGSKLIWWIDPLGAIVLSVLIVILWVRTAWTEFLLLVGIAASVETQQLITYISLTHSNAITGIDTVRVYHSGPRLIAEVDVVMDPRATLAQIHDTAETLQVKLESLPDIERAYVHVDYETTHKPEHSYNRIL